MFLQELNSYITGHLKNTLLVLDTIIILLFFELALVFLIRFKLRFDKNELKNLQERAYFWLIFGFAMNKLCYIIGDYYIDISVRAIFYDIGYVAFFIGGYFYIYIMEKCKIFIRKFFFSGTFAIFIIIFIFILIFAHDYVEPVSGAFLFLMVIFFLAYIKSLISDVYKKRGLGNFTIDIILLTATFFSVALGYALTGDLAANIFGLEIRIFSSVFEIIGFIFASLFLLSVPSFSEYDWQERINSIYIVHKSGQFIFKKLYKDPEKVIDDSLVAGSITSVNLLLKYITQTEGPSILEKENKIIIIQPGEFFNGIVISDENLVSLQILLKKFVSKIEELYRPVMRNWKGKLNIFAPLDKLAKEYFF